MARQTDKSKRPRCAKPEFAAMPAELTALRHWVMWRYEWRDDKDTPGKGAWTKVPYQPSGRHASSTGAETWSSFSVCLNAFENSRARYDGVGFVFTQSEYAGVDLDDCVTHEEDAAEFRITPFAARVVERLQTYTELSPSITGLHMIGKAAELKALKTELDGNEIEVYSTGRYFTFSGNSWQNTPLAVRDINFDLTDIVEKIRTRKAEPQKAKARPSAISVDERLKLAMANQKLADLFNGDTWEYGGDDSRADFALCRWLAYYADGSTDLLDAMFRKSKLYRNKWDDRRGDSTYGEQTIAKILGTQKSYLGSRAALLKSESTYESRKVRRFKFNDLWEAAMEYRCGKIAEGVHPGCPAIARHYRPRKGLMTIIIGDPGCGKTTMVDTWAYYIARNSGWPITFASFETQPIHRHILDLCQIHLGKPTFTFIKGANGESIAATDEEMEQARIDINEYFNFLMPEDDEMNLDSILRYVDDDIRDFGTGGFVLDPWSELDQTRDMHQTQTEFIDTELRKLRSFTRHREIHTWLIVHPTKAGENRINGRPTLYSATGSAHFYKKADYGIVVHTPQDNKTTVYIDKVRFSEVGTRGAEIEFLFDQHARRYLPLA